MVKSDVAASMFPCIRSYVAQVTFDINSSAYEMIDNMIMAECNYINCGGQRCLSGDENMAVRKVYNGFVLESLHMEPIASINSMVYMVSMAVIMDREYCKAIDARVSDSCMFEVINEFRKISCNIVGVSVKMLHKF